MQGKRTIEHRLVESLRQPDKRVTPVALIPSEGRGTLGSEVALITTPVPWSKLDAVMHLEKFVPELPLTVQIQKDHIVVKYHLFLFGS